MNNKPIKTYSQHKDGLAFFDYSEVRQLEKDYQEAIDALNHTVAMLKYEYKNGDGCPEQYVVHFRKAERVLHYASIYPGSIYKKSWGKK